MNAPGVSAQDGSPDSLRRGAHSLWWDSAEESLRVIPARSAVDTYARKQGLLF